MNKGCMLRTSVFVCVILLLICGVVPAWAQAQGAIAQTGTAIHCSSATACGTGFVPVFTTNGGAAKVDDSIVSQSGSTISVAGNVSATETVTGEVFNATTGFQFQGSLFAFGSTSAFNAFDGFAGNTTMTGTENTASGWGALSRDTSGADNTAVGYFALLFNQTGSENTAVGEGALEENTTGPQNTAIGQAALNANTTGEENTAVGPAALGDNTTGGGNVAVGFVALLDNTTGIHNTAVGANAAQGTNGTDQTCIGFECGFTEDDLHNASAIGAHAKVGASNALVLGGIGEYAVKVGIGTTTPSNVLTIGRGLGQPISDSWETYSSRRWKTNIEPLHNALGMVEQLRGVSYDLKDSGKHEIGVIAEEVGKVVPEVVSYENNGKDARGVDYSRLTALLIEATKEQQALIHKQQQQIQAQKEQMKAQQVQIGRLNSQVKTIQASLNANGQTSSEILTVKAQVPMIHQ